MSKRLNVLVENCGSCPYLRHGREDWDMETCGKVGHSKAYVCAWSAPPDWCPLPDDVPLHVAAHVTHMELVPVKEQPQ